MSARRPPSPKFFSELWEDAQRAALARKGNSLAVDNAIRVGLTLNSAEAARAYADVIASHVKDGELSQVKDKGELPFTLLLALKETTQPGGMKGELIVITPYMQVVVHHLEVHGVRIGNQPDEWQRRD